eukprot:3748552-Pyramimonas_sp.AAC.1
MMIHAQACAIGSQRRTSGRSVHQHCDTLPGRTQAAPTMPHPVSSPRWNAPPLRTQIRPARSNDGKATRAVIFHAARRMELSCITCMMRSFFSARRSATAQTATRRYASSAEAAAPNKETKIFRGGPPAGLSVFDLT